MSTLLRAFLLLAGLLAAGTVWAAAPYTLHTIEESSRTYTVPERWLKQWFGDMPEMIDRYPKQVRKHIRITLPQFRADALPQAAAINAAIVQKAFEAAQFFYPEPIGQQPLAALKKTLLKEILRYEQMVEKEKNYFGETRELEVKVIDYAPPVLSLAYTHHTRAAGNGRDMVERQWFTLDTRTGEPILPAMLFRPDSAETLARLTRDALKQDPDLKAYVDQVNTALFTEDGWRTLEQRMALTRKGLKLMLPLAGKTVEVTLPYERLRPVLKADAPLPSAS